MDAYESDNYAYEHMRKNGIHRQKRSGPRKGQYVHETVGGRPFKAKPSPDKALGNILKGKNIEGKKK